MNTLMTGQREISGEMKRLQERTERTVPARSRRDRGFSLVEMVITVSLIGLVMVPVTVAAFTLVKNSSFNRNATKVETVLSNAADRVNRAPESCDYTVYLEAAVLAEPGWSQQQVSAEYRFYVPGTTAAAAGSWTSGACPVTGLTAELVQLVEITVSSPDGVVHRSIQVVKSRI